MQIVRSGKCSSTARSQPALSGPYSPSVSRGPHSHFGEPSTTPSAGHRSYAFTLEMNRYARA